MKTLDQTTAPYRVSRIRPFRQTPILNIRRNSKREPTDTGHLSTHEKETLCFLAGVGSDKSDNFTAIALLLVYTAERTVVHSSLVS